MVERQVAQPVPERAELTIQRIEGGYRLKLYYTKLAVLAERPLVRG